MPKWLRNVGVWLRENWLEITIMIALAPFVVSGGLFDQCFGVWWALGFPAAIVGIRAFFHDHDHRLVPNSMLYSGIFIFISQV